MAPRRAYTHPVATDALHVIGQQIRIARRAKNWTAAELAARMRVSQRTILAVEAGAPGTAAGTVFTAAALVGVPLFGVTDPAELARIRHRGEEHLALLPSRVYHPRNPLVSDDDF